MRHTYLRLTGLLLALLLVLSGCNLIGIDPIMQLDEDFAKLKKQYSGVVATYDGGEITQADVMASFSSQYNYMSQLYSMYGINVSSDLTGNVEQTVVEEAVRNVAIAKQIEARGLKLDDDKLAEVQAEADEHYKEAYDSFYANATGENDEVRAKQTEYNMAVNGYTKEALYNMELASANTDLVEQAVRDEITEVTDEELKAAYDAKVEEDETTYANGAGFESAMSSEDTVVCWIPEGYRTVKHILVVPDSDTLSAYTTARSAYESAQSNLDSLRSELDALNSADEEEADEDEEEDEDAEAPRTAEEIQADIDAAEASLKSLKADMDKAAEDCLAAVKDKTDEIYAKLEAGEDFGALIDEYGEDPGMKNEPSKTRGYYVSATSANWDKSFTEGAMALESVGDYTTTPVVGKSGVHIIRYESDATAGAVPFEDVKEALYDSTLENMRSEHYNSELESWISALNAKYSLDAFKLTAD